MIEIKNNDKKVVLENISENEPNKIIVKLDIKDGIVIPKKSIYQFDTGLEVICSKNKEEVFVEANTLSEFGCFSEDMTINLNTDNKIILNIENFYNEDITINQGKKIAILYKYVAYNETEDYDIVYEENDIIVGEKSSDKEYKAENVEIQYLPDDVKRLSMDLMPV